MKNEPKFYTDHQGYQVPARNVTDIEKKKDKLANAILKKARSISEEMEAFKLDMVSKCDSLFEQMLKKNEIKKDHKGGYSITSFDKRIKIEVTISNRIEFDDHISLAQAKINDYISEKTEGMDDEVRQLIESAFQRSKGTLDAKRVLGLKSIQIKHKLWLEAMALIDKSININSSKRYFSIWEKNEEGEYKAICLNFSNI